MMSPEEAQELQEWRRGVDAFMKDSVLMDHAFKRQLQGVSEKLEENTVITKSLRDDLGDALPALKDLGGAWRTIKRVARPLAYFAAFCAACVTYWKTGEWHVSFGP